MQQKQICAKETSQQKRVASCATLCFLFKQCFCNFYKVVLCNIFVVLCKGTTLFARTYKS